MGREGKGRESDGFSLLGRRRDEKRLRRVWEEEGGGFSLLGPKGDGKRLGRVGKVAVSACWATEGDGRWLGKTRKGRESDVFNLLGPREIGKWLGGI